MVCAATRGSAAAWKVDAFSPVAWSPDGRRIAYVRAPWRFRASWLRGADRSRRTIEILDLLAGGMQIAVSEEELGDALAWTSRNALVYSLLTRIPNQTDGGLWSLQLDAEGKPAGSTAALPAREVTAQISATADGRFLAAARGFSPWHIRRDKAPAATVATRTASGAASRNSPASRSSRETSWYDRWARSFRPGRRVPRFRRLTLIRSLAEGGGGESDGFWVIGQSFSGIRANRRYSWQNHHSRQMNAHGLLIASR